MLSEDFLFFAKDTEGKRAEIPRADGLDLERKLPRQVHSSKLEFSDFNFLMYMAGGIRPRAS